MEEPLTQMEKHILISPGLLQPVVNKCFNKFSEVQWSMLAAGMTDSDTELALSNMFTEIVQSATTAILNTLVHSDACWLPRSAAQAGVNTVQEKLHPQLRDSLLTNFAVALLVPQVKCESAERLTKLIEQEVSLKVNSIVSMVMKGSCWPEELAVFVSGAISHTEAFLMVSHVTMCLQGLLVQLSSQSLEPCCQRKMTAFAQNKSSDSTSQMLETEEPKRYEASEDIKSKLCSLGVTETVSNILLKWSNKSSDTCTSQDSHCLASKIVNTIINDLHYIDNRDGAGCYEDVLSIPHFNMGLIIDQVKDFYTAQSKRHGNDQNNQTLCKQNFMMVTKKVFELNMAALKQQCEYLVNLTQESVSFRRDTEDENDPEYILPGAVPEIPRPQSEPCPWTAPTFDIIEEEVESLFYKMNVPEESGASFNQSFEIKKISKALVDKVYGYLSGCQKYQTSFGPNGRSLSDSVIFHTGKVETFPEEVVCDMTEDAVGQFLQQVLLWMETHPANKPNYTDQVSGALSDIKDLISHVLTSLEGDMSSWSSESYESLGSTWSSEPYHSPGSSTLNLNTPTYLGLVGSPTLKECKFNVTSEVSFNSEDSKQCANLSVISEWSNENTIVPLVLRIMMKAPKVTRLSIRTEDITHIVERLTKKAEAAINCDLSINKIIAKKLNKAVIRDLKREFGCSETLLLCAMALDTSPFDDAVVKYLKIHLDALESQNRNKSAVVRFFTAAGRTLKKPFTMCMSCCSNND